MDLNVADFLQQVEQVSVLLADRLVPRIQDRLERLPPSFRLKGIRHLFSRVEKGTQVELDELRTQIGLAKVAGKESNLFELRCAFSNTSAPSAPSPGA
jgi:hypothetical protein